MVGVTVRTGPVSHRQKFSQVDKSKWKQLVREKRGFIAVNIPNDCRCLLEFREEAEEVWRELGYDSRDDMIRRGYELDPEEVETAYQWLKRRKPEVAVKYADAIVLGQHGGDRRSEKAKDQGDNITLIQRGTDKSYTLARLHRDHPELAERVEAGELSANAAAIEAGFRKKPTPLDNLKKNWAKASDEDKQAFRSFIDDPNRIP